MKNGTICILGVIVVALGIGIVLWSQKKSPETPASLAAVTNKRSSNMAVQSQSQSTIASPSPAPAPGVGAGSPRKFSEMRVLERNAILDKIAKQDLPSILQAMLDAARVEQDPMKQMHLQSVLSDALRLKSPSPEFLNQVKAFVADSSNSRFERQLVIGALRSAATKETVDLMIQIATTSADQDIRQSASALASVDQTAGAGEKLSPSFERVWRETNDQNMLFSAAASMGKIGAPSGIELLLDAVLTNDRRDNRLGAAYSGLAEVYLPKAVPPLAARLTNQPPTSAPATLIAPILVNIGDVTAANAVISWLQGQTESAAPLIHNLFEQTRTEKMLIAWTAAIDPAVPFRNEQNREAIRAGLAQYNAGRK